jgi:dTMP kinase
MDYKKSLEIVEKALTELKEENNKIPIIVEGEKDIKALKKLDITGKIYSVNAGISIIDFCDNIARKYKEIIILTDWDRKGGYICYSIKRNLSGRVKCNTYYREIFAKNTMTKTVEGLPSWIKTIIDKNINL